MIWLLALGLSLAIVSLAQARPARLAWDFDATTPPQHTGFLLRGCQLDGATCVMRDAQRLGPRQRQTTVQIPGKRTRCFVVHTLQGQVMSDASNMVCLTQ
jgi:hypothetical protein